MVDRQTDLVHRTKQGTAATLWRMSTAHLAVSVSQLLVQSSIAALQRFHLRLQLIPCTMCCRQLDLGLTARLLLQLLCLPARLC